MIYDDERYCSGSIVNIKDKFYISSAQHCLNEGIEYTPTIKDHQNNQI